MGTTGATAAPARPRASDHRDPEPSEAGAGALTRAERRAEAAMGAAFLCAAAAAASTLPASPLPGGWVLAMSVGVMALASAVRLDVPGGRAVPIMLASVPVMFLVPPGLFPLVTAAALLLGGLAATVLGRARPDRLLLALPNAWFTIGPAVVLGVWGASPAREPRAAVLVAALLAQIATDVAATAVRERLLNGPRLGEQIRGSWWVHAVDVALAPAGYAVAMAAERHESALLLVLPVLWLLDRLSAQRGAHAERLREVGGAYRGTALALGHAIPSGDPDTAGRRPDVLALALGVADALGLDDGRRRLVEFGVLLSEVGAVAIPAGVGGTPDAPAPDAFELVAAGTDDGWRTLVAAGGLAGEIGGVVRGIDERWDGGGSARALR